MDMHVRLRPPCSGWSGHTERRGGVGYGVEEVGFLIAAFALGVAKA
jgi:hypothetical protein